MNPRLLTAILITASLGCLVLLAESASNIQLPGYNRGYEPQQPIAFSHRLHAGELQIGCKYCHTAVERSPKAGMPSAQICMNCHRFVRARWSDVVAEDLEAAKEGRAPMPVVSPELKKLYEHLGLEESLRPVKGKEPQPIRWVSVYDLPDFVRFNHQAHVLAGVECQRCHGPVEHMERIRQFESLSMGWCVNCHREVNATGVQGKKVNAPTDCSACHF